MFLNASWGWGLNDDARGSGLTADEHKVFNPLRFATLQSQRSLAAQGVADDVHGAFDVQRVQESVDYSAGEIEKILVTAVGEARFAVSRHVHHQHTAPGAGNGRDVLLEVAPGRRARPASVQAQDRLPCAGVVVMDVHSIQGDIVTGGSFGYFCHWLFAPYIFMNSILPHIVLLRRKYSGIRCSGTGWPTAYP